MPRIALLAVVLSLLALPRAEAQSILFEEPFDDANLGARGWFDSTAASISASETVAGSTGALQFTWPRGEIYPTNGRIKRRMFTPTESVYFRAYLKVSAGWQGSGVAYHPHLFYLLTTEDDRWIGPGETHMTFYMEPVGAQGKIRVAFQDSLNIDASKIGVDLTPGKPGHTEARGTAGCNGTTDGVVGDCYNAPPWRNYKQYDTPTGHVGTQYRKVEVLVRLNTLANGIGQADGVIRVWVDDAKVMDRSNVLLRTSSHPNMKFNEFAIGPYIGPGSPVEQTLWIDELLVATDRAAGLAASPRPPTNLRAQ